MDETFWKAGFFILFLIWFFLRGIYGRKANRATAKEKIRPGLESFLVGLNVIGMTILPLLAVFTPFLGSFAIDVPEPARFVFFIIFACNIGLFYAAHRDLGTNWSNILEIKEEHRLVTHGIYKKIRHPMYAHFWIWVVAQGIVLANWLVLVFGVVAWGLLYFIRVPREEEMMIAEFGDEYREYMKQTGRVIPKI